MTTELLHLTTADTAHFTGLLVETARPSISLPALTMFHVLARSGRTDKDVLVELLDRAGTWISQGGAS